MGSGHASLALILPHTPTMKHAMHTSRLRRASPLCPSWPCATALMVLLWLISPTLASAQGFTPSAGSGWAKLGVIGSRAAANFTGSDELRFDPQGERGEVVPFRARQGQVVGGELTATEVTLDALYAPLSRVVFGLFMPVYKSVYYFNDVNNYETRARGVGDVSLYGGYQLTPPTMDRIGVTLYGKLKAPLSRKYPYTNEAILGEGQVDAGLALGGSFKLLERVMLHGALEYRHRRPWSGDGSDAEVLVADPGDEVHGALMLGASVTPWLWVSAGWSGFWGQAWELRYVDGSVPTVQRTFHAGMASAYLSFGDWVGLPGLALDLFVKLPFAGQDHAVMRSFGAGLARGF